MNGGCDRMNCDGVCVCVKIIAALNEAVRMLSPELVERLKSSQIMLCDIEARTSSPLLRPPAFALH